LELLYTTSHYLLGTKFDVYKKKEKKRKKKTHDHKLDSPCYISGLS
jgi:hypothetical protein